MIYELSYLVGHNTAQPVRVLAGDEIELAHAILDMERDVGKICFGVEIKSVPRTENFRKLDRKSALQRIQSYAKILEKDCKK
jgi:hypothetical protein